MKTLLILTWANIKMYFRNRGALIWTLFFPFIVIAVFGILDFGKFSTSKIGFVYDDATKQYAEGVEEVLGSIGDHYKTFKGELDDEKQALIDDDRMIVLEFLQNTETKKIDVKAYLNKGSEQSSQALFLIIQKILTDFDLQLNQIEPTFQISQEEVNVHKLKNIDFVVPGIIAMSLMQGGIFGVVGTIVTYREKGVLKRLFATPLPKLTFLLSQILSRLVISILQVAILLGTAYAVFQIKIVGNLLLVAGISVLGSLVFLSMGFAISGIAKTTEAARAIVMPIQMIMMLTSGVYFPREILPDWLYKITDYVPLTHLAESLRFVMTRGLTLTDKDVYIPLLGLLAWLVFMVVFAVKSFKWEK